MPWSQNKNEDDDTMVMKLDSSKEIPIDSRFRLPARFTNFREPQIVLAEQVASLFEAGADIICLEATVGFGKSLFAEMVRQLMNTRMIFAAPRIDLQKQFYESIDYSKLLQGRSNFPHGGMTGPQDFPKITCADCRENSFCRGSCQYKDAKAIFMDANVGVTNTSYFLAAANYLQMFKPNEAEELSEEEKAAGKTRRPAWRGDYLTCFDEADLLGQNLLKFLGVVVNMDYVKEVVEYVGLQWEISIPKAPVGKFDGWFGWLQEIKNILAMCSTKYGEPDNSDVREVRWYTKLQKTMLSLEAVRDDWVYDPEREKGKAGRKTGDAYEIKIKPKIIGEQGVDILWKHCGKVLCMSGTFVNINIWKEQVGLDVSDKKIEFIRYDSDWDKKNALIHRVPGVEMVKVDKKASWKAQPFWNKAMGNIANILMRYENERTMIYANSYELASDIGDSLISIFGEERIIVDRGEKIRIEEDDSPEEQEEKLMKAGKLNQYLATPGGVIVSPKFGRGTDLYGARCRNIIIAKTPFPYLGDRRTAEVKDTTKNGRLEYMINTVRETMQIVGRGRRFRTDWVRVWVVDDRFDSICEMRGLLPLSFSSCIRKKADYLSKFPPLKELEA